MDTNGIVNVLNALPTSKLIDTVSVGLGKAFEPRHIKKMAEARAFEINTIGEALRNNNDVIVVYDKGNIVANTPEFEDFVKRTEYRLAHQELQKQYNIEAVIGNAYIELETKENVSEDPVDEDWLNSFFDSVANISNNQMQIIWGKLLAGEIENPGKFSIRTLDTLRKLTQMEAELFLSLFPYVLRCWGDTEKTFYDYFILDDAISKINVSYSKIILLSEANLISSNNMVTVGFSILPMDKENIYCLNSKIEFTNLSDQEIDISARAYILTEVGKALYNVLCNRDFMTVDKEYLCLCRDIFSTNKPFFGEATPIENLSVEII